MKKVFRVDSANWFKDIELDVDDNDTYINALTEAATLAVNCFFNGDVKVRDIYESHTIDPIVYAVGKEYKDSKRYRHYFYAPVIMANAGYHKEASLLHQKINMNKYKSVV
jgi:hypothetical protein